MNRWAQPVSDEAGKVIEVDEHAGEFKQPPALHASSQLITEH